jgi:hypothetical protein
MNTQTRDKTMTKKQTEIMGLIQRCGYVTVAYGDTVSGYSGRTIINIKRAKRALLALVRDGVVKQQRTELADVRYIKS